MLTIRIEDDEGKELDSLELDASPDTIHQIKEAICHGLGYEFEYCESCPVWIVPPEYDDDAPSLCARCRSKA